MRYFVYLAYDGTNYHGWQVQPNGASIQGELVKALSTLLRHEVDATGAGRTDAGVHAARMIAHFDTDKIIDTAYIADKLNRLLPPDIAIDKIVPVRPDAHARFDAISRTYKYYVSLQKNPFERAYCLRIYGRPLDFDRMNEAASVLADYTDFTSFSKLHTDVKTNDCRIMQAHWEKTGKQEWTFTIQADRFLRNMVRAIVGTLFEVGRGKLTVDGFRRVIEQRDRGAAGTSVPGHALFLVDIAYPDSIFLAEK